jgi:hypothetical protein
MLILSLMMSLFITYTHASWVISCENYCSFKEFSKNCQGIYWQYSDGFRSYSEWSDNYNGCLEKRIMTTNIGDLSSHLITPNYISCNCGAVTVVPPNQTDGISQTTKDKLALLRDQINTWMTCAPVPENTSGPFDSPFRYKDIKTCRQFKLEGKKSTFFKMQRCESGQSAWSHDCNYHGDLPGGVFWMCLAGNQDRCQDIKRAQNQITGAWFRNEHQRQDFRAGRDQPLFSRDHTIGALGYLAGTRDKPSGLKWLTFIRDNPKILGQFNICPPRPNITKPPELTREEWENMIPDDRCDVRPNLWGLFYMVYKYIGFSDSELQNLSSSIFNAMMVGKNIDLATLQLTAETAPATGSGAYQIQLVADEIQIRLAVGQPYSQLQNIVNLVNNRTAKLHPRYHFLAKNRVATEYGAYLIQKYCRPQRPHYGYWASSGNESAQFESASSGKWYWGGSIDSGLYQYFGSKDSYDRYWLESGHECVNWINLYLGNTEERNLICDQGEKYIDGACLTISFPKPYLAPVAGLGYSLGWPWEESILSGLINQKSCYSTGTVLINDPDWNSTYYNWCKHIGAAPLVLDINNINEYVDPNPLNPGIYYSKINNQCPFGGVIKNNACLIYSYTKPNPSLYLGINYWVENNSNLPGVYYPLTNGQCLYGGQIQNLKCFLYQAPAGKLRPDRVYFIRRNAKNPGIYHYPIRGGLVNYSQSTELLKSRGSSGSE